MQPSLSKYSHSTTNLQAADIATPYVKKGVDVATPYVKATASLAQDVSKPIVNAAGPIVQVPPPPHTHTLSFWAFLSYNRTGVRVLACSYHASQ